MKLYEIAVLEAMGRAPTAYNLQIDDVQDSKAGEAKLFELVARDYNNEADEPPSSYEAMKALGKLGWCLVAVDSNIDVYPDGKEVVYYQYYFQKEISDGSPV